jgi:pilus assembly protein CpaC
LIEAPDVTDLVLARFAAQRMRWFATATLCVLAGFVPARAAVSPPAAAQVFNAQTSSQMLHVVVGHSVFLNTNSRLRRVYISNPAVLDSYVSSPSETLVTAKAPGVSTLVLWDSRGQNTAYSVSADIDVNGLHTALFQALPGERVEVSALQDRVTLAGVVTSQAAADVAQKLAQIYSKDVVNSLVILPPHPVQVQLKVRIAEVDRSKLAQFGVNFLSGGKNASSVSTQQFTSFGSPLPGGAASSQVVTDPLNLFLYNSNLNIGLAIADLEQRQILQILAEPTITSLSGEQGSFLSGGEFPFPVVQGGTGNYTSITVQFRPYGVRLAFTPTVNPDGTIRLKVNPEVSALDYTNAVQISGYTIPAIATRRAETELELRNGQSFAISGLIDHRLTDTFSKMPGIERIPILGQLFRSKNNTSSAVELVVIVTPTIVDPLTTPMPFKEPRMSQPNLDVNQFDQQVNAVRRKGAQQ